MDGLVGYGYVSDSDESLKTKSGAKFGGNFGVAVLTKFAYNPNVAKVGEPAREAIEIIVQVGERKYNEWINPVTKVVDKNNVEITDKTSQAYKDGYNALMTQQNATVTHYLKAVGVSEDSLKAVFATPITGGFGEYASRVVSLLPIGFEKRPLDLFLEYQWNFSKKQDGTLNDKTFPTLPKNMKGGYFIVQAQPGIWVEKIAEDGSLSYENSNGQKHPFFRDVNFMSGNKGKQQVLGQMGGTSAATAMAPAVAGNPNNPWAAAPTP
jgi:hypothetical protein